MTVFWMNTLMAMILGYIFGSIPFGVLLTRWAGAGDLRTIGSGNIGATNVLRTGRKGLAAATLLLDLVKGFAAVALAKHFLPGSEPIAAAGAFFGHLYPVWLNFIGGKGVATLAGIMFGLFWQGGVVYAVAWIGALVIFRISAVAGLLAAAAAPLAAYWFGRMDLLAMLITCALLVFWKHRTNIERLMNGTEPRIGKSGN